MLKKILLGLVAFAAIVYVWNASWRVAPPEGAIELIAHRGVHQTFGRAGLDNDTCTAERIDPPTHDYLENTLPAMGAAFAAGADIVELDVHPTTDGQFAVLHDWTVDCRTEGTGETRSHDMAYLKTLDIGYGYTADNGTTYPFRGKGVGMMPELKEVLATYPDRQFLINFKSREAREGEMLAALATAHPEWRAAMWGAYGGDEPTFRAAAEMPGLHVWSRRGLVDCLLQYEGLGWTGYVPEACRNTLVLLPINAAPFVWGWPNLFLARLQEAGSQVILLGPYSAGDPGTAGIDTPELLGQVPDSFTGYIWTNKIESIGPLTRQKFKIETK
jgi:glycerophosphoryl diester phosphodiesterase